MRIFSSKISFYEPFLKSFQFSNHLDKMIAAIAIVIIGSLALLFWLIQRDKSLKDSLKGLKKGFAVVPFLPQQNTKALFHALKCFHSKSDEYKKQFVEKEVEFGYAALKGKQVYVVRNETVPYELKELLPYFSKAHLMGLEILKSLEEDLNLTRGSLTNAVMTAPFPNNKNSTSLLRLFSYDPSVQTGCAADAHEDLGLLTIIPPSDVPALEVFDYSQMQWRKLEANAQGNQAIVLVGKTLEKMTNGKVVAAEHRVINSSKNRLSIVYQMRAEPETKILDHGVETKVGSWLAKLKTGLKSVNQSY